jgi:DNA replication protein DnaC
VLYIDDFFKTESGKLPTTAEINIAFEILNFRYNNPDLVTIISSEKGMSELLEIDEATGSRIFERSKDYSISIAKDKNKNYRLKE